MDKPRRRRLILAAGAGAAGAGMAGGYWWWRSKRASEPLPPDPAFPNALRLPGNDGLYGLLDAQGATVIVARPVRYPLFQGKRANLLAYEVEQPGRVLLNPTFRASTGARITLTLWNALEDRGIIHWHGFKVDSNNDGHPHYAVPGGATYDYQFVIPNRAGTCWYHPHPHGLSGYQIYRGMAGVFIVEDADEIALRRALDLRLGVTDIPLILQDKHLDADGNLVFEPNRAQRFQGYLGQQVLVNLTPRPHLDIASRVHRFRLLNASNSRIYRLAFRHGERLLDFEVIGTDGGLLDQPRTVKEAYLSPAERLDILLDLRNAVRGDALTLVTLPFDSARPQSAARNAAPGRQDALAELRSHVPEGTEMELMRIRVRNEIAYDRRAPSTLSKIEPLRPDTSPPRPITLDQKDGIWRINGLTYVARQTPIVVKRGAIETWEIRNLPPTMPHPFHIHGFLFQVRSRTDSPEHVRRIADPDTGLTAADLGWKDTVLVWPGETVRIAINFSHPHLGDQVYMVHCHNMEHEDGGMMLNLKVTA